MRDRERSYFLGVCLCLCSCLQAEQKENWKRHFDKAKAQSKAEADSLLDERKGYEKELQTAKETSEALESERDASKSEADQLQSQLNELAGAAEQKERAALDTIASLKSEIQSYEPCFDQQLSI